MHIEDNDFNDNDDDDDHEKPLLKALCSFAEGALKNEINFSANFIFALQIG